MKLVVNLKKLDNVAGGVQTHNYEMDLCDECSCSLGNNGKCTNLDCRFSK